MGRKGKPAAGIPPRPPIAPTVVSSTSASDYETSGAEEPSTPPKPGVKTYCVFSWGVNEDGQLGHDHNEDIPTPHIVPALRGVKLRESDPTILPLVASSRNTLAITEGGELYSWGWNQRGTLGHGHKESEIKPRRVTGLNGVRIKQGCVGGWHSLAVSEDGQAYAFGGNEYLQCGVESMANQRDICVPMVILPQLRIVQVAAGGMHSVAVTDQGQVFQWGQPFSVTDYADQEASKPRLVPTLKEISHVSAGAFHNIGVTRSGAVMAWGHNEYGQLGVGNTKYASVPCEVTGLSGKGVEKVDCGGWHSCAITKDGSLYVWGRGEYGRLGLGDSSAKSRLVPVLNRFFEEPGMAVDSVSCGGTHSMTLLRDGRAFVWGRGSYGRLGAEDTKNHAEPVQLLLPGSPEILAVSAGGRHSTAYVCYKGSRPPMQRVLSRGKSLRKPNV